MPAVGTAFLYYSVTRSELRLTAATTRLYFKVPPRVSGVGYGYKVLGSSRKFCFKLQ